MDKFRVEGLLEICKKLGLSVGSARQRTQILKLMEAEEVSKKDADEAHEDILEGIELELAGMIEVEKVQAVVRTKAQLARESNVKLVEGI